MSEKPPKVDPLLTAGPPPGTRIREEAPKPRPKGEKEKTTSAARSPAAPAHSTEATATTSPPAASASFAAQGVAESVAAELVEPGALVPASPAPLGAPVKKKTRKEREMERIGELETQIWASSARILQHALAAADVPDDGTRPPGWTDRKWRTARDARLNRREIPGYVEMAGRVVESFKRSEALKVRDGGGMPPALNGNITFYVNGDIKNTFNYPVVEQKEPE